VRVDDSAFGQLVAAESGRLARLGTLLTGDPVRGRALAEEALARALLGWNRMRGDEPISALRRSLFEVYGEWWHRGYRRYADGTSHQAAETGEPEGVPVSVPAGPAGPDGAEDSADADGGDGLSPALSAAPGVAPAHTTVAKAEPGDEALALLSHWGRAVALMDAEGRSEPEMVGLLGLSERTVARSRPVVPMRELASALATADEPVPVQRVAARAARIRRRRRLAACVAAALLAVPAVLALRSASTEQDQGLAERSCPTQLPGQVSNSIDGLAAQILPISPDKMYLCQFGPDGARISARPLDHGLAVDIAASINSARLTGDTEVCSREDVIPFVLRVVHGKQLVTLLASPAGCGRVTNGVRTVSAGRDLLTQVLAGQLSQDPESAVQACAGLPQSLHNEGGGLLDRMVGFTGQRVIVCPDGLPGASVGEINGDEARALALAIDQAPTRKSATGTGCPSARRLVIVITGGVQRVDIEIDAGGCGWASNGFRVVELTRAVQDRLREVAQLPK
jgi:hypothetical protein